MSDLLKNLSVLSKTIIPVIILATFFAFIYFFWPVIMPFVLSFILAYLLTPLVNALEYRGLSRTQAITTVYICIAILIIFAVAFLFPVLSSEIETLRNQLPSYVNYVRDKFTLFEDKLRGAHPYFQNLDFSGKVIAQLTGFTQGAIDNIPNVLGSIFSFFYMGILIPFITFFLIKDGYQFRKNLIKLIPNKYFEMILGLIFRLEQQLGDYIRGKLLQTVIISVIASIGLFLADVPYAIFIGIFAGIINMIPYIGPIIGSIPALIVAFVTKQQLFALLPVSLVFIVVQLVDNIILQPLIVARSIDMHPLFVIASLTFGGYVAGIWGMILGIPLIGMLKVVVQELYKEIRYRLYNTNYSVYEGDIGL